MIKKKYLIKEHVSLSNNKTTDNLFKNNEETIYFSVEFNEDSFQLIIKFDIETSVDTIQKIYLLQKIIKNLQMQHICLQMLCMFIVKKMIGNQI